VAWLRVLVSVLGSVLVSVLVSMLVSVLVLVLVGMVWVPSQLFWAGSQSPGLALVEASVWG